MKKIVITLILLIIIFLGTLPFFLPITASNNLSIGANFISSFASLITLVIALLLFSKYGIEKTLLDKQADAVIRLLTELKKVIFILKGSNHNVLFLHPASLNTKYWEDYKERKLLFGYHYANGLKNIWDIADDIFLPAVIVEKLKPVMVMSIISQKSYNLEEYFKVTINGDPGEHQDMYGLLNDQDTTVEKFSMQWLAVINSAKKWLGDHSNLKKDINFERS